MVAVIWATRGWSWGFRFLLDGGLSHPLARYEEVFLGAENEMSLCLRRGGHLALRFPDPEGRMDSAGRVIPHDFVLDESLAASSMSIDDGRKMIWPLVADVYARVWRANVPPSIAEVRAAIEAQRS